MHCSAALCVQMDTILKFWAMEHPVISFWLTLQKSLTSLATYGDRGCSACYGGRVYLVALRRNWLLTYNKMWYPVTLCHFLPFNCLIYLPCHVQRLLSGTCFRRGADLLPSIHLPRALVLAVPWEPSSMWGSVPGAWGIGGGSAALEPNQTKSLNFTSRES